MKKKFIIFKNKEENLFLAFKFLAFEFFNLEVKSNDSTRVFVLFVAMKEEKKNLKKFIFPLSASSFQLLLVENNEMFIE